MSEAIKGINTRLASLIEKETGENAYLCYQCGKCTSGCPLAEHFDLEPNQVMRAIQLGLDDQVLQCKTIWLCASCQTCNTRCPQGLDIPKIMDHLVMLARKRGIEPAVPEVDTFYKVFHRNAKLLGRAYEAGLIGELNLRIGQPTRDVFDLGVPMILKRKIKLFPAFAKVPKKVERREVAADEVAYYPGCSLHSTATEFDITARKVAEVLGLKLTEPEGWTCCGSTPAHRMDPEDAVRMPLENLALIEKSGFDQVAVPCASCFSRLRAALYEINEDPDLRERMDEKLEYVYQDQVEVTNLVDIMANRVGLEAIADKVEKPLEGLKVACYYGCLLTRPPEITGAEHPEYPMNMDKVIEALGAEAVDWDGKTGCCGGSLVLGVPELAIEMCVRLLEQARAAGADCIAAACPLCQANLDGRQLQMKELEPERRMPILYFTQLMTLAFGLGPKGAVLNKNIVDPLPLLREKSIIT
jgi:heterodisulfide reductase subunit B